SWGAGVGIQKSLADDNTVVAASFNQIADWFDKFDIHGNRVARVSRSTSNANIGLTQLLSPTTVAHVAYGLTVQTGTLGNTWNAVPLNDGTWGDERLPSLRHRHALVGRLAQRLPWNAALHGYYRLYLDDWGIVGNTIELALYQRIGRWGYLR